MARVFIGSVILCVIALVLALFIWVNSGQLP